MLLFHVTIHGNLDSIERHGIDPAFSRGARAECWYVTQSKVEWAVLHVARRHIVDIGSVYILSANISRAAVVRRRSGVYTHTQPVKPSCVLTAHEYADIMEAGDKPPFGGGGKPGRKQGSRPETSRPDATSGWETGG